MPEAEMAEVLECAPGTVKSRVSRALDRLRVALQERADA
jgi:DNA-directed RNA polymerase specialized sigma24 family protein